jgi:hypothetical protein
MGQSIVVTEKPSSNRGVVRFETNRALTGMGHERYLPGTEIWGNRPPDELARRLLARESVAGVQINGNVVTVDLNRGYTSEGLIEVIENLYRFYPDQPAAEEAEGSEPAEAPSETADEAPATEPPAQADGPPETAPEVEADPELPTEAPEPGDEPKA